MSDETKAYVAFVLQAASVGIDKAIAVAVYIEKPTDDAFLVRQHIERDLRKGNITQERRDRLISYVSDCTVAHQEYGKVIDNKDPKDWVDLGNGARMHAVHKDSERMRSHHVSDTGAYVGAVNARLGCG